MKASHKSILIWSCIIGGIILLLWFLTSVGTKPQQTEVGTISLSQPATAQDHSKGAEGAAFTLVEYSDFECPACAARGPVLEQLLHEFPNDVRIIYRHFPLTSIHDNAMLAAQATEAAAIQGKFWDMHDVLFNTQQQWSTEESPQEYFTKLANSIGLNTEQFTTDITSQVVENAVKEDTKEAEKMKLPGTPSFFLNGQKISFNSYEELAALITKNE
ncbi:MAG: thioredoxin domain-containing protein [Candidatus Magasanikbacteria bacterium]|jgi:protein-disulfide isomerase|nr:thioredoxin domain-containing protein [Candidatus Magasanikbacteria bacterium]MBT5262344.1 thioredoxin domain-containing protein [Candidatus Magasanikbacteria bacterium]MBT5820079.1 thioredoxin domain-containing protein [Candidatus Magasanikbacteria bacterium]|tara:strand:+ start:178 stop:825 length:648 start_codon:yes stop_codon:yes gene_type:complete